MTRFRFAQLIENLFFFVSWGIVSSASYSALYEIFNFPHLIVIVSGAVLGLLSSSFNMYISWVVPNLLLMIASDCQLNLMSFFV